MSLSGHFSSKHVQLDKPTKEYKTFEDFPARRLRHADGSHAHYKGGKMVPGSHEAAKTKHVAKKDVESTESKFYTPTPVSTIVERNQQGEKETAGEKESVAAVRKRFDPNNRAMKL